MGRRGAVREPRGTMDTTKDTMIISLHSIVTQEGVTIDPISPAYIKTFMRYVTL